MQNDTKIKSTPTSLPPPKLSLPTAPVSANDQETKETETVLDRKQAVLRDMTGAVADGGLLGLYIYGRAGTGKSYLVRDELERRETRYVYTGGHITAKGLFQLLRSNPNALHVFDDIESIFRYTQAVEILRTALASLG